MAHWRTTEPASAGDDAAGSGLNRFGDFSAGGCANAFEKPLKRFSLRGRAQAPAEAEAGC